MVGGCLAEVHAVVHSGRDDGCGGPCCTAGADGVSGRDVETLVPDDEELGVTDGGGEGCLEGTGVTVVLPNRFEVACFSTGVLSTEEGTLYWGNIS